MVKHPDGKTRWLNSWWHFLGKDT